MRTKWNCGKELLSEMFVTWKGNVFMDSYVECLIRGDGNRNYSCSFSYIVRKAGKCGEGKPLYVSHDDRKVELCLVCWLGKDREEVDACLLVKCFGR